MTQKPKTVICDIDGTISTRCDRDPMDLTKVIHDYPLNTVIEVVQALEDDLWTVVYLTARGEESRFQTRTWLELYAGGHYKRKLFMRKKGDERDDVTIKSEIYHDKIEPFYDVKLALDDNSLVIAWWRSLGIQAFHVAEGMV